jgi:hypothetical protein
MNDSLLKKYRLRKKTPKVTIILISIINHRYLMPDINNIKNVMEKYIMTAPVSGCRKVRKEGINTIINTFTNKLNSSFNDGFGK